MKMKIRLVLLGLVVVSQVFYAKYRWHSWTSSIHAHSNTNLPPGYVLMSNGKRFKFKDGDGASYWCDVDGYATKQAAINDAWREHQFWSERQKEAPFTNFNEGTGFGSAGER